MSDSRHGVALSRVAHSTGGIIAAMLVAGCGAVSREVRHRPPPSIDPAQPVEEATLRVEVDGVSAGEGVLRGALYLERARFLTTEGVSAGQSVDATAQMHAFVWRVPPGAEIVVSVFQDLDSDGSLDRGPLGAPSEPWGFSGRPWALLPPTWDACVIRPVPGDNVVSIKLFGARRGQ